MILKSLHSLIRAFKLSQLLKTELLRDILFIQILALSLTRGGPPDPLVIASLVVATLLPEQHVSILLILLLLGFLGGEQELEAALAPRIRSGPEGDSQYLVGLQSLYILNTCCIPLALMPEAYSLKL